MSNSDALRALFDLACPNCGQADTLHITITCTGELTANGSEALGDHEWEDDSFCLCPECEHQGVVENFRIPSPEVPS